SQVDPVDRVPEQVGEEGLDAVVPEAREERPDADANRREERPDQERHPEGGADDPQHEAPEDSFDVVVDRRQRRERLDETADRRVHDQREDDAPDDAARVVDDAADDEVDRGIREAVIQAQDQIAIQCVEVELGKARATEPEAGHRRYVRRDESGDDRAPSRVVADQELDVRVALPPAGERRLHYITLPDRGGAPAEPPIEAQSLYREVPSERR